MSYVFSSSHDTEKRQINKFSRPNPWKLSSPRVQKKQKTTTCNGAKQKDSRGCLWSSWKEDSKTTCQGQKLCSLRILFDWEPMWARFWAWVWVVGRVGKQKAAMEKHGLESGRKKTLERRENQTPDSDEAQVSLVVGLGSAQKTSEYNRNLFSVISELVFCFSLQESWKKSWSWKCFIAELSW